VQKPSKCAAALVFAQGRVYPSSPDVVGSAPIKTKGMTMAYVKNATRESFCSAAKLERSADRKVAAKGLSLVAAMLTLAVSGPAAAQFPAAPAEQLKGTPVTPARLPDGRPNWTGFWVRPNGLLETYRGPSGVTGQPANANTPTVRRDIPVLKSPYKEQYEAGVKKAAVNELGSSTAACLPQGMPRMMGAIYGLEILQTPKIIAMTSEWQSESRRIWMDVKEHPPADELDPTFEGHSIGRWEGDVLVVETAGIREPLDQNQIPRSANAKVTERFREVSPGVLVDEITVVDPDVMETPWKYQVTYVHKPDFRIKEYVCLENNRNVDAAGRTVFN
jgi:hypothetical protein